VAKWLIRLSSTGGSWLVLNPDGQRVAMFKSKADADEYAQWKNKD